MKYITNDLWKDVCPFVLQRNSNDNEFLFVNKTTETKLFKFIANLSKLSSYKSIYINDIQFDPIVFNKYYDMDIFAYNETEFARNAIDTGIVITIPSKDLNIQDLDFNELVLNTPIGYFRCEVYQMGLLSYKLYAHTNNWISGRFFDYEYAFIVNVDTAKIENVFPSKLITFNKLYHPQFIESRSF